MVAQQKQHSQTLSLLPSRLYCRFRNRTESCADALADFTADREFHPALKKILYSIVLPAKGQALL